MDPQLIEDLVKLWPILAAGLVVLTYVGTLMKWRWATKSDNEAAEHRLWGLVSEVVVLPTSIVCETEVILETMGPALLLLPSCQFHPCSGQFDLQHGVA